MIKCCICGGAADHMTPRGSYCKCCKNNPKYVETECGLVTTNSEHHLVNGDERIFCQGCSCGALIQTSNNKMCPRDDVYEFREPHIPSAKIYNYEDRNKRMYVKNYQYIPDKWEKKRDPGRLFGFELEVQYRGYSREDIENAEMPPEHYMRKFGRLYNLFTRGNVIAKHDSSISGESGIPGFELVSAPMSSHRIESHYNVLGNITESLYNNGFRSSKLCGIHIHVTNDISKVRLLRIVKFFINNPDFILSFSGKNYHRMEEYSSIKFMAKNPARSVYNLYFGSRKTAINITRDTIEFRTFCSTVKPNLIIAFYQFVKSMMELSSHTITIDRLKEYAKNYPELKNRLSRIVIKDYYKKRSRDEEKISAETSSGYEDQSDATETNVNLSPGKRVLFYRSRFNSGISGTSKLYNIKK